MAKLVKRNPVLAAFSLLCMAQFFWGLPAVAQQPGNVEGTKLWYITVKKGGVYMLADTSGNRYSFLLESTSRNINFHPAVFVNADSKIFDNFSFSQATVLGAFFPDKDTTGVQKYFSVKSFGKTISFRSSEVITSGKTYSFGSSQKRTTLSVKDATKQENAMKTAVFYFASGKTYNSIWGEDKQTDLSIDFDGYLPELIIYNRVLTPLERAKIETYLSIKYGTTLDNSYISSSGKILWNILDTTLKKFHNRVCAIGKDTLAAIFQPKSNTAYEEEFNGITSIDLDANDSTITASWPYIPKGEEPSLYRSVTIGFADKTLHTLNNGEFIFWGDNALSTQSNEFKVRYPTQYADLQTVQRNWLIYNPSALKQGLRFLIAGGDYPAKTLFNTLYDPFDYQLYRFVILKLNGSNGAITGKPILCNYFGREQSPSLRFDTRSIIWDNLSIDHPSGYNHITFGKVPILNFLMVRNQFNNTNKILEYPYYPDSAIKSETNFDTTVLVFNYTGSDSTLKFSYKTSVGVGNLKARIFLLRPGGELIALPASFITNNQTPVEAATTTVTPTGNEGLVFEIKAPDEDNPSSIQAGHKAPIKYIKRNLPADKQKFKEFQVKIPLKNGLNLNSRLLIEVTDDLGQRTTLPIKFRKP